MHDLLLVLELLGHSGWVLGQEGELPGCSMLVLISSRLGVLTVLLLLLLRNPLVLVLVLTLMLVLVTLLKLMWWVA
jgi:hypothetical protein